MYRHYVKVLHHKQVKEKPMIIYRKMFLQITKLQVLFLSVTMILIHSIVLLFSVKAPEPKSALEALEQRYKELHKSRDEANQSGNSTKARRLERVAKVNCLLFVNILNKVTLIYP